MVYQQSGSSSVVPFRRNSSLPAGLHSSDRINTLKDCPPSHNIINSLSDTTKLSCASCPSQVALPSQFYLHPHADPLKSSQAPGQIQTRINDDPLKSSPGQIQTRIDDDPLKSSPGPIQTKVSSPVENGPPNGSCSIASFSRLTISESTLRGDGDVRSSVRCKVSSSVSGDHKCLNNATNKEKSAVCTPSGSPLINIINGVKKISNDDSSEVSAVPFVPPRTRVVSSVFGPSTSSVTSASSVVSLSVALQQTPAHVV